MHVMSWWARECLLMGPPLTLGLTATRWAGGALDAALRPMIRAWGMNPGVFKLGVGFVPGRVCLWQWDCLPGAGGRAQQGKGMLQMRCGRQGGTHPLLGHQAFPSWERALSALPPPSPCSGVKLRGPPPGPMTSVQPYNEQGLPSRQGKLQSP